MPQLETSTFFSQFFWTILCLFALYFYVYKYILPQITRLSKLRSKKNASSSSLAKNSDNITQTDLNNVRAQLNSLDSDPDKQKQACATLLQYAMEKGISTLSHIRNVEHLFLLYLTNCKYITSFESKSGKKDTKALLSEKSIKPKASTKTNFLSSQASLASHLGVKEKNKKKEDHGLDLSTPTFISQTWKKRLNEIFAKQGWEQVLKNHTQNIETIFSCESNLGGEKQKNQSKKFVFGLRRYNFTLLQRNYNNAVVSLISRIPLS